MESSGSNEDRISGTDMAKCSDTKVEIKIKTLDSRTYTLRVDKCVPIPALKEQIASVTGILSEQQRLICSGKVLKDDQLLSAYYVEDGHTLHLVTRQPIQPSSGSSLDHPASSLHQQGNRTGPRVDVGTLNLFEQGGRSRPESPDLRQIVSTIFGVDGITIGSGNEGADNIWDASAERLSMIHAGGLRNSGRQGNPAVRDQYIPYSNAFPSPASVPSESLQLPVIPDALSTLSQYLIRIRREISTHVRGGSIYFRDAEMRENGRQQSEAAAQAGARLRTPSFLADLVLSTRQILTEQAADFLSQLSQQLENQANVIDPLARSNIQDNARMSGVLLQHLGAMLLELGRTTMTLQLGQSPDDAIVNAGPPVFISTFGPNPIMIQPLPFQPERSFGAFPTGTLQHGYGLSGASLSSRLRRNVNVRIRTGPLMPPLSDTEGEPAGVQQSPVPSSQLTSGGRNSSHQSTPGASESPSLTRESGVPAVPIRMIPRIPASIRHPPPDFSQGSTGLFHPVLARFEHAAFGNLDNERDPHPSDEPHPGGLESEQQPTAGLRQNVGADVCDGSAQVAPATSEVSPRESDQEVFLSSLPLEIEPAISENASRGSTITSLGGAVETEDITTQSEENSVGGASARQLGDPKCPSCSKHQREQQQD